MMNKIIKIKRADKKVINDFFKEHNKKVKQLIRNLQKHKISLDKLLADVNEHWTYEDLIYRFYHQSYKVYYIQDYTLRMFEVLKALAPKDTEINSWIMQIVAEGTGKKFRSIHNKNWLKHTRNMLEAFFHMKYFLEMAIEYATKLDAKKLPEALPSGWAGLLYFYNLR